MLTISGITYRIAGRTLIEDASAQIADGWKVGLIGRNGTGKSTLLDLIRGERGLDGGAIALPRGCAHRLRRAGSAERLDDAAASRARGR